MLVYYLILILIFGVYRHFQQYFNYNMGDQF